MNIRAAIFIQRLRGLTVVEKAVAQNVAVHADAKTAIATMGMSVLAEESCLQNRETASRVVKRLEAYGVIRPVSGRHSRGGRSQTTEYQFTFSVNRDSGITVCEPRNRDCPITVKPINRDSAVTVSAPETVTPAPENCDFDPPETVTQNAETVTPQSHEGFKVKEKALSHSPSERAFSRSEKPKPVQLRDASPQAHRFFREIAERRVTSKIQNPEAYISTQLRDMNLTAEIERYFEERFFDRIESFLADSTNGAPLTLSWEPLARDFTRQVQQYRLEPWADAGMLDRIKSELSRWPHIDITGDVITAGITSR